MSECPCYKDKKSCLLRNSSCHIDCARYILWKNEKNKQNEAKNKIKKVNADYKAFELQQKLKNIKGGRIGYNKGLSCR